MRPKVILDWYERDQEYVVIVPGAYENRELYASVGDFFRMREIDFATCEVSSIRDSRYQLKDNGYCTNLDQEGVCYFIDERTITRGQLLRFIEDLHLYMEAFPVYKIDMNAISFTNAELNLLLRRAREVSNA